MKVTLQVDSKPAILNLNQQNADMNLDIAKPNLGIQQHMGQINMSPSAAIVTIDTTQSRKDLGYMSFNPLENKFAKKAMAASMKGIARLVNEGRQLMEIEKGADNTIAKIAERNAWPEKQFGFGITPKHGPDISIKPGDLGFNYDNPALEVNLQWGKVNLNPVLGGVETYLGQKPEFSIVPQGEYIDLVL